MIPENTAPQPRRVQAVEHAVDVLDSINRLNGEAGVSELARQTGMSKAAVHHLLATLEERRFVAKDPETAQYRLGWALYELGSAVVHRLRLERIAAPHVAGLAALTKESVLLAILIDDELLYVASADSPSTLRMVATSGRRSSLQATASGKVLLAFHEDPSVVDRLTSSQLPRWTPTTITDPAAIRKELQEVESKGFATCWEEREVGLCSIAVPIRNYTNQVVAALTLAGPRDRLNADTASSHLRLLKVAGDRIQRELGARQGSE